MLLLIEEVLNYKQPQALSTTDSLAASQLPIIVFFDNGKRSYFAYMTQNLPNNFILQLRNL
jgi:hypothetical protein